jgi:hypothetical protein
VSISCATISSRNGSEYISFAEWVLFVYLFSVAVVTLRSSVMLRHSRLVTSYVYYFQIYSEREEPYFMWRNHLLSDVIIVTQNLSVFFSKPVSFFSVTARSPEDLVGDRLISRYPLPENIFHCHWRNDEKGGGGRESSLMTNLFSIVLYLWAGPAAYRNRTLWKGSVLS